MDESSHIKELGRVLKESIKDTTPERIKTNRGKWYGVYLEGRILSNEVITSKAAKEIEGLMYELHHYFDTGYRAPHSIDELPSLIEKKIEGYLGVKDALVS